MRFENAEVFNFEGAFRGLRNPLESWDKSDSYLDIIIPEAEINPSLEPAKTVFILGENDLKLARKLINGGTEHRKFLRQILVSVDITAPLYWWKEFDTYKVGTVANSTSTMHKIMSNEFSFDMFEFDDFITENKLQRDEVLSLWIEMIATLNRLRFLYLETSDKFYWKELIRLLPSSWLQTRTITMNYENLISMYYHRRNHKLTEWHRYCDWIETLPYAQALLLGE